jgi:hypothetical protein
MKEGRLSQRPEVVREKDKGRLVLIVCVSPQQYSFIMLLRKRKCEPLVNLYLVKLGEKMVLAQAFILAIVLRSRWCRS